MTLDQTLDAIEKRFAAVKALHYTLTFRREAVVSEKNEVTARAKWEAALSFDEGRGGCLILRSATMQTRALAAAELLGVLKRSELPRPDRGGKFRTWGEGGV